MITKGKLPVFASVFLIVGLLVVASARAASEDPVGDTRFDFLTGSTVVQQNGSDEWLEAQVNFPLGTGDRIWSNANARAEIIAFNGAVLRMGELTSLTIDAALRQENDGVLRLSMAEGKLYVHTGSYAADGIVEINLPQALLTSSRRAVYRVDAFDDGTIQIFVHEGEVTLQNSAGANRIKQGELFNLVGGAKIEVSQLPPRDEFDIWSGERDLVFTRPRLAEDHLPREIVRVYPDLDTYGTWVNDATYGYCWTPTVSVGWRPFYNGRWAYWRGNYTWISYEPWGWVPYHYGRWFYRGSIGWCWAPPIATSIYWYPGAVAWYSGPSYVYWVPLAPREYYYGCGLFGPYSVNVININFTKYNTRVHHRNFHHYRGMVYANRKHFLGGKYHRADENFVRRHGGGKFENTPLPPVNRHMQSPYRLASTSRYMPPARVRNRRPGSRTGEFALRDGRGGGDFSNHNRNVTRQGGMQRNHGSVATDSGRELRTGVQPSNNRQLTSNRGDAQMHRGSVRTTPERRMRSEATPSSNRGGGVTRYNSQHQRTVDTGRQQRMDTGRQGTSNFPAVRSNRAGAERSYYGREVSRPSTTRNQGRNSRFEQKNSVPETRSNRYTIMPSRTTPRIPQERSYQRSESRVRQPEALNSRPSLNSGRPNYSLPQRSSDSGRGQSGSRSYESRSTAAPPRTPFYQPQRSTPSYEPRTSIRSNELQRSVPSFQPRTSIRSNELQRSAPSYEPRTPIRSNELQRSAPSSRPQRSSPFIRQRQAPAAGSQRDFNFGGSSRGGRSFQSPGSFGNHGDGGGGSHRSPGGFGGRSSSRRP